MRAGRGLKGGTNADGMGTEMMGGETEACKQATKQ